MSKSTSKNHTKNSPLARVHETLAEKAFLTNAEHSMLSPTGDPAKWYLDFRSVLLDGPTLRDITELYWQKLQRFQPFQVGGLETAAIALVAGVVLRAKQDDVALNGFYVRKSRKKDGLQRMVEGTLNDLPIVLIDDGINSGKSFVRQIDLLRLLGKKVAAVCALVQFRDESFYAYFKESGIEVISIFTLDDFPKTGGVVAYMRQNAAKKIPPPREIFSLLWKFESSDPSYIHILPKSAPALDDERVYFGADNGTMWALNQADGAVAWSYRTLFGAGKKRIFSSPAVHDGTVYFGAYDGNFYALDAKTGKKKWTYWEADWIGSSPCVAPNLNTVFIGLEFGLWKKEGGIAALGLRSGEKKWWQPLPTMVHSSPTYSSKHNLVVVGSTQGIVYAFDAKTGALRWKYETGGAVRAGFAIDERRGLVAFGSEDRFVHIVDTKTGNVVYKVETLEPICSTPIIKDGKLFFGLLDKRIMCIDLNTREVVWTFWTSSRVFATPLIAEGRLYCGSNDGRLYELDPATGKEIGYLQATERIVNRVAYNTETKRFFVPTYGNEIYCLERKPDATPRPETQRSIP